MAPEIDINHTDTHHISWKRLGYIETETKALTPNPYTLGSAFSLKTHTDQHSRVSMGLRVLPKVSLSH